MPQGRFRLARYPQQRRQTLRAWDAADEYLLNELAQRQLPTADSSTYVLNDGFGALCTALAAHRPQLISDSFLSHRGALANFAHNGLDAANLHLLSSLQQPTGSIDLLLVKIPKSLALLEDQLFRLRPHLHAKTQIFGAAMSRDIHTSTLQLFERIAGPTSTSLAKKKARLVFCRFDADLDPGKNPHPTHYALENTPCVLHNHAGVFSRDGLDIGTRFFLPHIPRSDAARKIADLGCGNGVIGIVAAERNPRAELLFVDESFMAVESARMNFAAAFGDKKVAQFQAGDGLADCAPNGLDLVLNNPPFHRQRAVDESLPWRMFSQAKNALKSGGQLLVVGNAHLNHQQKLRQLFGRCQTLASNGKFVVLGAIKR